MGLFSSFPLSEAICYWDFVLGFQRYTLPAKLMLAFDLFAAGGMKRDGGCSGVPEVLVMK